MKFIVSQSVWVTNFWIGFAQTLLTGRAIHGLPPWPRHPVAEVSNGLLRISHLRFLDDEALCAVFSGVRGLRPRPNNGKRPDRRDGTFSDTRSSGKNTAVSLKSPALLKSGSGIKNTWVQGLNHLLTTFG